MSRTNFTRGAPVVGVPRASGDEPGTDLEHLLEWECSPRERG